MTDPTGAPILVVEDDIPTQNLLRAVLRRYGFDADVAADGREAIGKLQTGAYAAVVLDVMMPGVGGSEVVEFVGAMSSPVPVVVCSAAGPKALAALEVDVVKAIIRKPFEIDELIATVRNIVLGTR